MTAGVQKRAPKIGRVARWKLTEPLRLYLWPVVALLAVSGLAGGFRDGDWWRASVFLVAAVFAALLLEAARASCYSPAGMMRALREAFDNR